MRARVASREAGGFYTGRQVLGARCTRRVALDVVGGVSKRHCRLSPGMWTAVSVVIWSGRKWRGFSDVAGKTGRGGGASVCCSAGQGWHRDWDSVPCQRACSARPGEAGVHGNAAALSAWTGHPS
jgi:hypothetical protein